MDDALVIEIMQHPLFWKYWEKMKEEYRISAQKIEQKQLYDDLGKEASQ